MNNLISVLKSAIKAKIVPLWTKLKFWTNTSFLQSKVLTWIRQKFTSLFGVKPRHKDDYYTVGRLLVSRRLIRAIVVVVGVLSLVYIIYQINVNQPTETGTMGKLYWYNSIPLRFTNADVRIKAKDGHIAYSGHVQDGVAKGFGKLYDSDDAIMYSGDFDNNMYNGTGMLYYKSGEVNYNGQFVDNLFEGTGKLYRSSGVLEYEGDFVAGKKEGQGQLYNGVGAEIFNGTFHNDGIVYNQLLGKAASDIFKNYTGSRTIYVSGADTIVVLEEINAFFKSKRAENSLYDEVNNDQIYVMTGSFIYGEQTAFDMNAVKQILGKPSFEGNAYINLAEAVGVDYLGINDMGVDVIKTHPFDEAYSIENYNRNALVYLYMFEVDDLTYTFVCRDRDQEFLFYSIE